METFITAVHLITAVFMILVVLIQGGHSGGIGAAFGGANAGGVFGAGGATSILGKITYFVAAIFMLTSISLTMIEGSSNIGLKEKLKAAEQKAAGETTMEETKEEEPKDSAPKK